MMISNTNFFTLLVLLVGALPLGITAKECHTTSADDQDDLLRVAGPDDLGVFDGCTTIIGSILVASDFSGSFILNGVTDFSGEITMNDQEESHDMDVLEMLDLLYVKSITLPKSWGLKDIRLPKVQRMESLSFIQSVDDSSFDLGALKDVDSISIAGSWTNISFPALETVSNELTIVTDPSWDIADRPSPLDIQLPSLREVHRASIRGHVKNLDTPKVEVIGSAEDVYSSGFEVQANYTDCSGVYLISLHKLYGEILLDGHIKGANFNGMFQTEGNITIRTASLFSMYSGLQDGGFIDLSGPLEAIGFEDLFTVKGISIKSSIKSECPISLVDVYRAMHPPGEPDFCDSFSIKHAGENPWAANDTSTTTHVTAVFTATSTSTYTSTSISTPTPTPSPVDTPVADDSGTGLQSRAPTAIVFVCILVGSLTISSF